MNDKQLQEFYNTITNQQTVKFRELLPIFLQRKDYLTHDFGKLYVSDQDTGHKATLLGIVAAKGSLDMVKAVVEAKPEFLKLKHCIKFCDWTVLHFACNPNHGSEPARNDILLYLLKSMLEKDVNTLIQNIKYVTNHGFTIMHHACIFSEDVAEQVMLYGGISMSHKTITHDSGFNNLKPGDGLSKCTKARSFSIGGRKLSALCKKYGFLNILHRDIDDLEKHVNNKGEFGFNLGKLDDMEQGLVKGGLLGYKLYPYLAERFYSLANQLKTLHHDVDFPSRYAAIDERKQYEIGLERVQLEDELNRMSEQELTQRFARRNEINEIWPLDDDLAKESLLMLIRISICEHYYDLFWDLLQRLKNIDPDYLTTLGKLCIEEATESVQQVDNLDINNELNNIKPVGILAYLYRMDAFELYTDAKLFKSDNATKRKKENKVKINIQIDNVFSLYYMKVKDVSKRFRYLEYRFSKFKNYGSESEWLNLLCKEQYGGDTVRSLLLSECNKIELILFAKHGGLIGLTEKHALEFFKRNDKSLQQNLIEIHEKYSPLAQLNVLKQRCLEAKTIAERLELLLSLIQVAGDALELEYVYIGEYTSFIQQQYKQVQQELTGTIKQTPIVIWDHFQEYLPILEYFPQQCLRLAALFSNKSLLHTGYSLTDANRYAAMLKLLVIASMRTSKEIDQMFFIEREHSAENAVRHSDVDQNSEQHVSATSNTDSDNSILDKVVRNANEAQLIADAEFKLNTSLLCILSNFYGDDFDDNKPLAELISYELVLTKYQILNIVSYILCSLEGYYKDLDKSSNKAARLDTQIQYLRLIQFAANSSVQACRLLLTLDVVQKILFEIFNTNSFILVDDLLEAMCRVQEEYQAQDVEATDSFDSRNNALVGRLNTIYESSQSISLGKINDRTVYSLKKQLEKFTKEDYQAQIIAELYARIERNDMDTMISAVHLMVYGCDINMEYQDEAADNKRYSDNAIAIQQECLQRINRKLNNIDKFVNPLKFLQKYGSESDRREYCQRMDSRQLFEMICFKPKISLKSYGIEATELSIDNVKSVSEEYPIAAQYCIFHRLYALAVHQLTHHKQYDYPEGVDAFYAVFANLNEILGMPDVKINQRINLALVNNKPWNFVFWTKHASPLRRMLEGLTDPSKLYKEILTERVRDFNSHLEKKKAASNYDGQVLAKLKETIKTGVVAGNHQNHGATNKEAVSDSILDNAL